jgi:lipopolysaccharide export system protein LptA
MKFAFRSAAALFLASFAAVASTETATRIQYSATKMIQHKGTNVVELKGNAQVLLNGALAGTPKIRYSANKMISNDEAHSVELIGRARVVCGRDKITGNRMVYTALSGGDVRLTADDLKVELPPKGGR